MDSEVKTEQSGEVLLEMRNLMIEGQADDQWHEIVHGPAIILSGTPNSREERPEVPAII